ncbi:hypothetical protein FRIG_05670 [Frigoribacterium faeni]|uniref:hypothetical protein n=1 Tax=Frigoribacterium faeni TaxID=145483 RepID=UPI001FAD889C|nr:hypothetical protein [Frigoribacterium faeni]MCJ0700622.1 hypothetical protein [Frigoribacterium faeni]
MSSFTWPGSAQQETAPVAVILPGTGYTAKAPLLYWSAVLLCEQGWRVRAVEWDVNPQAADESQADVERELQQAGDAAGGRVDLVVAKSFGTLGLPWAVAHAVPGVWLTPVLTDAVIFDALVRASAAHLAVGGSRDPLWSPAMRLKTDAVVQTMEGADHSLLLADDWHGSLDLHKQLYEVIAEHAKRVR